MSLIEDLFTARGPFQAAEPVGWDPLQEPDALLDAQLLESRFSPTANRAALLFDMRTAACYPLGNAAILVVRGLNSLRWNGLPQQNKLMAFSVMSSQPSRAADSAWLLNLQFFPDGDCAIGGECAEFYLLEAHGISEAPPSYPGRHLDEVQRDLPAWTSRCTVLQFATTNSAG
ncbi:MULTISPECIES: hypothetical protein [unclassified Streptomyces]|uniref:hypothetical protein n=1 Tax=unclassified Streptomyces TaxID=2593676 RepID=UPI00331E6480